MDAPTGTKDPDSTGTGEPAQAVLAEVTCSWAAGDDGTESATAVIVHSGSDMLVLEASDPARALPPIGTPMHVAGTTRNVFGRLAEHGRTGRFLISLGNRPVRTDLRLKVSLSGTLRSPELPEPATVEIADLTTSGARVRGIDLPIGSQVALEFTPPGRDDIVIVRARVAHTSRRSEHPWVGIVFRLVALRGGRASV